jgi:RNA polymerase sigma-70 factor, ECF subfamily
METTPEYRFPSRAPDDKRESELLQRIAQHERQAFDELYLGYHRRLTRFVLRLAPRYDIAEEVINDTFWVVWNKAAEFRGGSRVSTWIMGIAYRRTLKTLRALKPNDLALQQSIDDSDIAAPDPNDADVQSDWVLNGLQRLPVEQRITIELAYYLDHSCEEIAAIMQCPVGTVKARMYHARQRLKLLLPQLS